MPERKPKSLFSPVIDFWLLGGLSLLVWVFLVVFHNTGLRYDPALARHWAGIGAVFAFLGVFMNTPHFYWSYRLAYGRGWAFVRRNQFQLIWVPMILLFLLCFSAACFLQPELSEFALGAFRPVAALFGLENFLGFYKNAGAFLLGLLFVTQYTTLGWHYSKQTFGTSLLSARFGGYTLTEAQFQLLKWTLFGIWFNYLFEVNSGNKVYRFGGLEYPNLGWPTATPWIARAYLLLMSFLVLKEIVWKKWVESKKLPPIQSMAPFLSLYLWFIPGIYLRTPGYFEHFVPFFHGLQYLTFVGRVEANAPVPPSRTPWKFAGIVLLIVLVGLLMSEILPTRLDSSTRGFAGPAAFFAIAAYLFINLHHYFIDNVIWRASNPEIRTQLVAHLN